MFGSLHCSVLSFVRVIDFDSPPRTVPFSYPASQLWFWVALRRIIGASATGMLRPCIPGGSAGSVSLACVCHNAETMQSREPKNQAACDVSAARKSLQRSRAVDQGLQSCKDRPTDPLQPPVLAVPRLHPCAILAPQPLPSAASPCSPARAPSPRPFSLLLPPPLCRRTQGRSSSVLWCRRRPVTKGAEAGPLQF